MSESEACRLRARYADLVERANVMQRNGYLASAAALFEQSWRVEARLNAAGVWL